MKRTLLAVLRRLIVVFASRILYMVEYERNMAITVVQNVREGCRGGRVWVGVVWGVERQSVAARPPPLLRATLQALTVTEGDYGQIITLIKVCKYLFYSFIVIYVYDVWSSLKLVINTVDLQLLSIIKLFLVEQIFCIVN